MSLVEIKQVTKDYQIGEVSVKALKDIELDIEKQSFVSFVGPSGSGKTTLLNLIGCLDKPSSGEVFVNGTPVNSFSNKEAAQFRGQHLGFIFQNFNLLPVLTTYENVEYPLIMVQNIQPEPFSWLYSSISMFTIYNLADKSFLISPQLSYKPFTNFEVLLWPVFFFGNNNAEYGSKQFKRKVEIWMRFYF